MAAESPIALIYGYNGSTYIETTVQAGIAVPSGQPGFMALGSDGTNTRYLRMATDGTLRMDPTGTTVQPVSQSGTWTVQPGNTANTTPWLTTISQGGNSATITGSNALKVDGSAVTQPVSAVSLPLPTGAATESTLSTMLTQSAFQARINTLGQKTMANSTPVVLASDQSSITVNAGTNLNTSALALDATLAKLTIAQGASLGANTQALAGGSVTTAAPSYTTGQISPLSLTTAGLLRVDGSGVTQPISAASLPLPTGAATQTTLASILTNTPALGQATMANSSPVVIASNQSAVPVSGTFWQATQPISAASLPLPTGAATETTLAAISGKLPAALVGGRLDSNIGAINNVTPLMGNGVTGTGSLRVTIASDNTAFSTNSIQSGSWTVTANAGTNLNTSALALDASIVAQSLVDNAAFTDGTTRVQPVGFIFDEVAGTALTENDAAAARIDSKRAQILVIEDATTRGQRLTITAANAMKVDGSAVTQPVSQSGTWTVAQGTAAALSGAWPIKLTDGTNTAPTGDVAARASFTKRTDGTNVAPTMDVAARAGFQKVTDGTNTMPTGDAVARSVFNQISDGTTGPVAVKAASTAPVATDKALVVVISPNQQSIPTSSTPAGTTPGIAQGTVTTGATTNVAVRASTYNDQSADAQRSVSSANAADASAGTGARTFRIKYMTSAGVTGSEDITLNGTTAVNTVNSFAFIEECEVLTVGSGGSNAGILTIFVSTGGGGGTFATVNAGDNRSLWAHHFVANGKTCNITGMTGNNNNGSNQSLFTIQATPIPVANKVNKLVSDWLVNGGGVAQTQRTFGSPLQVAGPARIVMFVQPGGSPTIINRGSFDFYDQ